MVCILKYTICLIGTALAFRCIYASDTNPEDLYRTEVQKQWVQVADAVRKLEEKHAKCLSCKGDGVVTEEKLCKFCKGTGKIETKKGAGTIYNDCAKCKGAGTYIENKTCSKCRPYDVWKDNDQKVEKKINEASLKCNDCSGKGYVSVADQCSKCGGNGSIYVPPKQLIQGWSKGHNRQCVNCNGKGKIEKRNRCVACNGKGAMKIAKQTDTLKVDGEADHDEIPEVVKWLKYAADKGNAKAQWCLGVMYAVGDRVEKDNEESKKRLESAAKNGINEAKKLQELGAAVVLFRANKIEQGNKIEQDKSVVASGSNVSADAVKVEREDYNPKGADFMTAINQGLMRNEWASNQHYKEYEFDFDLYNQWKQKNLTTVQKENIFYKLMSHRYPKKRKQYPDYAVFCLALIPDGLSFGIEDIKRGESWRTYYVYLSLLCYGRKIPGTDEVWKGCAWQNEDAVKYLNDERLFRGRVCLVVEDEKIENWSKGKVLIAKGWVYEVSIEDGIRVYTDGSRYPFKKFGCGVLYRSLFDVDTFSTVDVDRYL